MEVHAVEVRSVVALVAAFLTAVASLIVVHAVEVRSAVPVAAFLTAVVLVVDSLMVVEAMAVLTVVEAHTDMADAVKSQFQHPDLSIHHTTHFAH